MTRTYAAIIEYRCHSIVIIRCHRYYRCHTIVTIDYYHQHFLRNHLDNYDQRQSTERPWYYDHCDRYPTPSLSIIVIIITLILSSRPKRSTNLSTVQLVMFSI